MKNAGEIIKISVILCLITSVAACLLGYANSVTAPIIEKNTIEKQNTAMKTVLPEAESFEETKAELPEDISGNITALYKGTDASGKTVGVCAMTSTNGYGGAVTMAVGVSADGSVSGIDIISHSETPGLGANASKDEFKSQFAGKTAGIGVSKGSASGNEINAVSGATITSKAVTLGVNSAITAAEQVLKEGDE